MAARFSVRVSVVPESAVAILVSRAAVAPFIHCPATGPPVGCGLCPAPAGLQNFPTLAHPMLVCCAVTTCAQSNEAVTT
eukprot:2515107-Amphidinium_carterae.1